MYKSKRNETKNLRVGMDERRFALWMYNCPNGDDMKRAYTNQETVKGYIMPVVLVADMAAAPTVDGWEGHWEDAWHACMPVRMKVLRITPSRHKDTLYVEAQVMGEPSCGQLKPSFEWAVHELPQLHTADIVELELRLSDCTARVTVK